MYVCCKPKLLYPLVVQTFLVIATPTNKNKIQEKKYSTKVKASANRITKPFTKIVSLLDPY